MRFKGFMNSFCLALASMSLFLFSQAVSAQELKTVRFAYSAISTAYLPLWIGTEAKISQAYGIRPEMIYISGGSTIMQALVSGEIEVAYSGGLAATSVAASGAKVKGVFGMHNVLPYRFFIRKELTGKVKGPEGLKGLKGAVSRRGSESEVAFLQILKKAGLSDRDMTILQVGGSGERLAALQSGAVDVIGLVPPVDLTTEKLGFPILLDLARENIPWAHTVVAMNQDWMRQQPALAEAVVKSAIEATYFGVKNKDFTKKVLAKYARIKDDDVQQYGYEVFARLYARDFLPSEKGFEATVEMLAPRQPAAAKLTSSDLVDSSIVKKLAESGFVAEMKKKYGIRD